MNADAPLDAHPAPQRHAMRLRESFFALFGGPIAWFVQLNVGYGLASQPCFRDGERRVAPHWFPDWTWAAMIALMILACAIALFAALVAWRAYARTGDEAAGDGRHMRDVDRGRSRFLALWGILLGVGAALATILTAVAFFVLPRCAG